MTGWLRTFWNRLWRRREPPEPAAPPPLGHNRPARTVVRNRESEGAYFYLRDVLDRLDGCNSLLRRLRRIDNDAYEYHRRVGAKILPPGIEVRYDGLDDTFMRTRPGQGMTVFFYDRKDHPPSLLYFQKLKRPHYVQPFPGGEIYQCIDVYFRKKVAYGVHFHIAVAPDGRGVLLRERGAQVQQLPGRAGAVVRMGWDWPDNLKHWFQHKPDDNPAETIEDFAWWRFCITANLAAMPASDELLVRCTKRGVTASFNVCTKRTPYFFKDRETTVASDGRRKRIFHIVAEHERQIGEGRTVTVKEHYRGERSFAWNGHRVSIAAPRTQGVAQMPVAGEVHEVGEVPPETLSAKEVGEWVSGVLETGVIDRADGVRRRR